jgi:hypothetical protein
VTEEDEIRMTCEEPRGMSASEGLQWAQSAWSPLSLRMYVAPAIPQPAEYVIPAHAHFDWGRVDWREARYLMPDGSPIEEPSANPVDPDPLQFHVEPCEYPLIGAPQGTADRNAPDWAPRLGRGRMPR